MTRYDINGYFRPTRDSSTRDLTFTEVDNAAVYKKVFLRVHITDKKFHQYTFHKYQLKSHTYDTS
jgi:hypothetical protein